MRNTLEEFIGKKIGFHYSDNDKKTMGLPKDYVEIFIGEKVEEENNQDQWIDLEYAIKHEIK